MDDDRGPFERRTAHLARKIKEGFTPRQISKMTGLMRSTICQRLNEAVDEGLLERSEIVKLLDKKLKKRFETYIDNDETKPLYEIKKGGD